MDFAGNALPLNDGDIEAAALALGVDSACVHAVRDIESAGSGFLPPPDNRPKILFESHAFHMQTHGAYDDSHPDISTSSWVRNYGPSGAHQWDRLEEALALNSDAALKSASWGSFQIMGSNFAACNFTTVGDFVKAMCDSEGAQLQAFVAFCKTNHLDRALRAHDWPTFARGYNGPGYEANGYDWKLEAAYNKWASTTAPVPGHTAPHTDPSVHFDVLFFNMPQPNEEVRAMQRFLGIQHDGNFGPGTLRAVKAAQIANHLTPDGLVGPATRPFVGLK